MERERDTSEDELLIREAELVRRTRIEEMRSLTPAQRLEQLHELCAQVSVLARQSASGAR